MSKVFTAHADGRFDLDGRRVRCALGKGGVIDADDVRRAAAAEVRSWAEARWGPLDRVPREAIEVRFAAYRTA